MHYEYRYPNKEAERMSLEVLEIGDRFFVHKHGDEMWAVDLLVVLSTKNGAFFHHVREGEGCQVFFRTRDAARLYRDCVRYRLAASPTHQLQVNTGKPEQQWVTFCPADFGVQFEMPEGLRTYSRKSPKPARTKAQ